TRDGVAQQAGSLAGIAARLSGGVREIDAVRTEGSDVHPQVAWNRDDGGLLCRRLEADQQDRVGEIVVLWMIRAADSEQQDIDAVAFHAVSEMIRDLLEFRRGHRIERDPGQDQQNAEYAEEDVLERRLTFGRSGTFLDRLLEVTGCVGVPPRVAGRMT